MTRKRAWLSGAFGRRTLLIFGLTVLGCMVLPRLAVLAQSGSQRLGFPLRYYWFDASPPPFSESRFAMAPFIANLLIYYVFALVVSFLVERHRSR